MRIVTGRRNKYRNKKTVVDGFKFDSKKEASRYTDLLMLQRAGEIHELELQPEFEIIPGVYWGSRNLRKRIYIADFMYKEKGAYVVEDVKSVITAKNPVYTLKRQLFLIRYPEYRFIET